MKIKHILAIAALSAASVSVNAQDCDLHLLVTPISQGEDIPDASNNALMTRLMSAVTATGVTADEDYGQFCITGRFTHLYHDVVPGPPMQTVVHTELTLYVADLINGKVYASTTFDLRGVGTSEHRAFMNAMSALNGKNGQLLRFVGNAKEKIIDYYDRNYPSILQKARSAAALRHYDEALFYTTSIPECSVGWAEASDMTQEIFGQYVDYNGTIMLNAARGAWAAQPDAQGAVKAWEYLMQIDPMSSAYPAAQKLAADIAKVTMDDKTFELRQKYKDSIDLERRRIDAARQVGVAWGNGQKPTTTNIGFLR